MYRRGVWWRVALVAIVVTACVACDDDDDGGGGSEGADVGADTGAVEDTAAPEDTAPAEDVFVEPDLPSYDYDGEPGPEELFQHGVASGDPLSDRVILWTRVTPEEAGEVEVYYEVALQPDITQRVAAGLVTTSEARDFTVKVDPTGLPSGTTLYYRFSALGRTSPVGRTRTAAAAGEAVERLRIGVTSCSNYGSGYFHAYREIGAMADLDLVLHLGDYIYEYGSAGSFRPNEPLKEIVTLEDYRLRYASYRRDPDLQEAHRQHPWIVVWDDHETANNSWRGGAQNHDPGSEGEWEARLGAAWQAWSEWLPVRDQAPVQIWRSFQFGDLVDLIMLDTRIWGRDLQVSANAAGDDLSRQLLGADQEAWLAEQLAGASARWQLLGQQIMMAQLLVGPTPLNADQWDGYPGARDRLFAMLEENELSSTVVLTGDIHTSWASELTRDPLVTPYSALGVEFVTPGVTSGGFPEALANAADAIVAENAHMQWAELTMRGYILLDVTPERTQAAWFHYSDIQTPGVASAFASAWAVEAGIPVLLPEDAPAPPPVEVPALAP